MFHKLAAGIVLACLTGAQAVVQKLSGYNVNIKGPTSVSGFSSGGFFAVQYHVAYASYLTGAAIFAGGPYDCAQGSELTAINNCMTGFLLQTNTYIATTKSRSGVSIDNNSYLSPTKVWMFSGTKDSTVAPATMDALETYYKAFLPSTQIKYINTMVAAHVFPTDDPTMTNPCTLSVTPYISNCNYDAAGAALQQIYGTLTPRVNTTTGTMIEFDQSEFLGAGHSFASSGYVYVPKACAQGTLCRLHIAFHGCQQNYQTVGQAFIVHSGYNKWADSNNLIILYPQTTKSLDLGNPSACWDWWGYDSDAKTYDTYTGPQMNAVYQIMQRIGSGYKGTA